MNETILRRRLEVLQCPFSAEVKPNDELSLQKLICWLEDVHIRRWHTGQRFKLRKSDFAPGL
eukprot:IDg11491t1